MLPGGSLLIREGSYLKMTPSYFTFSINKNRQVGVQAGDITQLHLQTMRSSQVEDL